MEGAIAIVILVLGAIWFLPTIYAWSTGHPKKVGITLFNLIPGPGILIAGYIAVVHNEAKPTPSQG